ncbi:hypothetical protein PROSTU_00527 [Providencia stuartii ATCC 25827]|uniref:Uncharacterized protein n=1 Tax=Providencia stuartii ATCC 25827 TaxID=471874 RepID=A0AA87CSW0_PROST|nr:hypothetical protein PROSTU_00527 [Providencia stuartii ATCC 25827]
MLFLIYTVANWRLFYCEWKMKIWLRNYSCFAPIKYTNAAMLA